MHRHTRGRLSDLRVLFGRLQTLVSQTAEDGFVRAQRRCWLLPDDAGHCADERAIDVGDGDDDFLCDFVLQVEQRSGSDAPIVRIGPEVSAICRFGELCGDPYDVPGCADRPLQDISGSHTIGGPAALHDAQVAETREPDDDSLGQPVGEIRRVAACRR